MKLNNFCNYIRRSHTTVEIWLEYLIEYNCTPKISAKQSNKQANETPQNLENSIFVCPEVINPFKNWETFKRKMINEHFTIYIYFVFWKLIWIKEYNIPQIKDILNKSELFFFKCNFCYLSIYLSSDKSKLLHFNFVEMGNILHY